MALPQALTAMAQAAPLLQIESGSLRLNEQVTLDELKMQMLGTIASAILYGIVVSLFLDCFRLLLQQYKNKEGTRNPSRSIRHFLFLFISLLVLLSTLAQVQAIVVVTVSIFGGPGVPGLAEGAPLVLPLSIWVSDAFMLWRCAALYQGISRSFRVALLAFLFFVFLAAIGSGISIFLDSITQRLPILLMVSFSTFLNVIVCLLIVLRLTFHQRYLKTVLGPGHGSPYKRIKAMSIESASLLILLGIPFVLLVGLNNRSGSMFVLLLYPQICALSPMLIVYRVAQGRSMVEMPSEQRTKDLEAQLGSLQFRNTTFGDSSVYSSTRLSRCDTVDSSVKK